MTLNLKQNRNVIYIVIALIVIMVISYWVTTIYTKKQIDSNKRQAVFLINGQVYFGHLKDNGKDPLVLSDVYYIQQDQTLPPLQSGIKINQDISLVKLGGELQGPEDAMFINKDNILFYENMKDDSKISKAINSYIKNSGKTTTTKSSAKVKNQ
jgi:hypothetical protein